NAARAAAATIRPRFIRQVCIPAAPRQKRRIYSGLMSCPGPGGLEQLRPRAELHARAAEGLAAGALAGVDRLPAHVLHMLDAALREQLLERSRARNRADAALLGILEQQGH